MTEALFHPVFIILCICFLLQVFTFLFFFSRFAFYKPKPAVFSKLKPVSVIITAKNEDENLREFLPSILEQDYPVFEVIVVNDQSEDDTEFVLNELELKYPQLKIVVIKDHINDFPGKKLGIMLGIKKARYEQLVFTDADCRPESKNWLKHIASNFNENTEIVLGFSPYFKKKSLLNLFIRFDTFYTALQYFSFCLAGKPYMGVGRNMAYKKDLFMKKGFSSHLHIPFGDDDLFVNKNANFSNTVIEVSPDSFVYSKPKESFHKWKRQKIRHLKAGKEYRHSHKLWLGFVWLSQVLFYLSFIIAVIFFPCDYYVWGILFLKMTMTLLIYGKSLRLMKQTKFLWFIPLLDPFYHLFIVPNFSFASAASRRNAW